MYSQYVYIYSQNVYMKSLASHYATLTESTDSKTFLNPLPAIGCLQTQLNFQSDLMVVDIVEGGSGDSCCLWFDLQSCLLSPRNGKNSQKAALEGREKRPRG